MSPLRTALLMRHAEALPARPGARDFDRALSPRGHADALAVGHWLERQGTRPSRVLCSPAQRALQTAQAVCQALTGPSGGRPVPECDATLYLAEVPVLVDLLEQNALEPLLLIGHNPGLAQLLETYLPALTDRDADGVRMPPAGLYVLELKFSGHTLARRGHRVVTAISPARFADGSAAPA